MPHTPEHKIRVEDLFWQSPIPKRRRELTDEEFEAIFNQRAREHRKGLLEATPEKPENKKDSSFLDWLIPKAGASERVGLMPQERANIFDVDALQEPRDRKLSPVEELADTEFRVQLNPQGIARYSNMYRNPSKYTGLLEYQGPSDAGAVYMDEPTALSENIWGHNTKEAVNVVPGQLVEKGKSYQVTSNMDKGVRRDIMHHEAFHDASIAALNSEFMPREFREAYSRFRQPGVGSILGIYIDEALAYQDQLKTASTKEYRDLAAGQLSEMRRRGVDKLQAAERDNRQEDVEILTFWLEQLEPERLDEWNRQILYAAKKRHEALGYK